MTEDAMQFAAEWTSDPQPGARDEARLSITVGSVLLTQLADLKSATLRGHFNASAVTLALWLADNWWRLRWETLRDSRRPSADWRPRHELTSAAGGTNWPPILIYSAGQHVVVAPGFGARATGGPMRYLELDTVHTVSGTAFELGMDAFFDTVVAVCNKAQDGAVLSKLVDQLRAERGDPGVAAWRSLEARLGYDPDEAPDALLEQLFDVADQLGESAIEEAASAAPGAQARAVLMKAVGAAESSEIAVDLSVADGIISRPTNGSGNPWQMGENAARHLRWAIGVHPYEPITNDKLSDILGTSWAKLDSAPAAARTLPYAARLCTNKSIQRLALQTRWAVDRRFELARVIADAAWTAGEAFGVIGRSKTERQKFQRGFAQSLLCPFPELARLLDLADPTDEQIARAARHFQVRPSVVKTLLVNKGVLPRETLEERLEAA